MIYYRSILKFEPIGQKRIPTKCPRCGNSDVLELNFYQKEVTTGLMIRMTKKVSGILYCHHTESEIPPVQWSDQIVNYFDTEKPKLQLLPTSRKVNKKGLRTFLYLMVPFLLLIAGVFIYFMYLDPSDSLGIQQEYADAEVNDKLKVEMGIFNQNKYTTESTYFKVNKIDGDTVYIQKHHKSLENIDTLNLLDSDFTAEIFKVRYDSFKIGYLTEWQAGDLKLSGYTKKLIKATEQ